MKYQEFLEITEMSKEELLAHSFGNLFDDPPEEYIRIPAPPMLMLDRVLEIERNGTKGRIVAEKDVNVDDWFFQCHFRNDPVQPGCLGVDAIWQMIGLYIGLRDGHGTGRALGCKEVEFFGQIRPHNKVVRFEVDIRRFTNIKKQGVSLALGSGKVFVDGEHVYTINDAKVGSFLKIAYTDYPLKSENSIGGIMDKA